MLDGPLAAMHSLDPLLIAWMGQYLRRHDRRLPAPALWAMMWESWWENSSKVAGLGNEKVLGLESWLEKELGGPLAAKSLLDYLLIHNTQLHWEM